MAHALDATQFLRPPVAFSNFVRRQTANSGFSHTTLSDKEVVTRVLKNWEKRVTGYREGVLLIPVEPDGFFTSTVELQPGDKLAGVFEARQAGEEPRKRTFLDIPEAERASRKMPATRVDIVLYSADTLAENGENTMVDVGGFMQPIAEWEIISINAAPTNEVQPMTVSTLLYNHFHLSGGTETHLSDAELVAKLREAMLYWRNKAMLG